MYPTLRFIFVSVLFALSTTVFAYQRPEPKWSDIGLTSEKQDVNYWLNRAPKGDKQLLTATSIKTRNEVLLRHEPSMVYWPTWPDSLSAEEIRKRMQILSKRPTQPLFKTTDLAISESDTPGISSPFSPIVAILGRDFSSLIFCTLSSML